MYSVYFGIIQDRPADKGILANAVWLGSDIAVVVESELGNTHGMARDITEVGFDDDFEIMKFKSRIR